MGAERVKKIENLLQAVHYNQGPLKEEDTLGYRELARNRSKAVSSDFSSGRRKAYTLAGYLAKEAVWKSSVLANAQHLFKERFNIHPIDEYIQPPLEFSSVDSFDEAVRCLGEILTSYYTSQRYVGDMLKDLETDDSFFMSKEARDNYRARKSVLEWAKHNLKVAYDYYGGLRSKFMYTRKQLISQIENVGERNDMCIHDPLYRFITQELRVPDVGEHRRINNFKFKFENNFLIPLINDVLIPGVKYVLLPLAIGTVFIFTGGTCGLVMYGILIKAGMTVTASTIAAAIGAPVLVSGTALLAYYG